MTDPQPLTAISTNGDMSAERCIVELQRGRAVTLSGTSGNKTIALIETMDEDAYTQMLAHGPCYLIISEARAKVAGIPVNSNACCLTIAADTRLSTLQSCAGLAPGKRQVLHNRSFEDWLDPIKALPDTALQDYANAGLQLALQAHVLPALLMCADATLTPLQLSVDVQSAIHFKTRTAELIELSRAHLPLASAENVELTVFREKHGNAEHIAITVGRPDTRSPVTVRLHSSCFTGDILGSLRCDCGEQLQDAIASMAQEQGGVVLYVSQEGRGIGLASKLLAYQLQDQGLDTIEANQSLGFAADERRYPAAVEMLKSLGISTVKLMTNNPQKIEALEADGIKVVARIPSTATVNKHNARYLETKRIRAGHLLPAEPVQ